MNAELVSTKSQEQTRIHNQHCVITLDLPQYFFYNSEYIDLHAPDGSHLETVGHYMKEMDAENTTYRLHEQIYLVESLLSQINHDVELPKQAISALADLLYRTQKVIEKTIK